MRALVVYESIFGNTEKIARVIADGLAARMSAEAVEVGVAPKSIGEDVALLVIGGPTHAWGMSRQGSRQGAIKDATQSPVSAGIGVRDWLGAIDKGSKTAVATFDTRFNKPRWLTGSAARSAQKQLRRLGFRIAAPAESFFVAGSTGPLEDGEMKRARRWGEELAAKVAG